MLKITPIITLIILLFSEYSFAIDKFHGTICTKDKDSLECTKAKAWMRRNHPDILIHERDKTMRQGIRARSNDNFKPLYGSLRACISCHVKKDKKTKQYPKITSSKHHCTGCHQKVSIKPDCFECHSTNPDDETLHRLNIIEKNKEALNAEQLSDDGKLTKDTFKINDSDSNLDSGKLKTNNIDNVLLKNKQLTPTKNQHTTPTTNKTHTSTNGVTHNTH